MTSRSSTDGKAKNPTARQRVEAKYPNCFGWRPLSISDYEIHDGRGHVLASAYSAMAAWSLAAKKL